MALVISMTILVSLWLIQSQKKQLKFPLELKKPKQLSVNMLK